MTHHKFDPEKLKKLNHPERLKDIPPDRIWKNLGLHNPSLLIDIGAGTGFFSVPFQQLAGNARVFACDISDVMIQWMTDNICPEHPLISPVKMDEARVPLDDDIADLVFMINLHHELENPGAIIQESFRLLKDNGKILILDWKKIEMDQGPPVDIRVLPETVENQLHVAGFKDITHHDHLARHFYITGQKPA